MKVTNIFHLLTTFFTANNITAGVGAHNVTPNNLYLKFNLRFSTQISGEAIQEKVKNFLKSEGIKHKVSFDINAEPFYSEPNYLPMWYAKV